VTGNPEAAASLPEPFEGWMREALGVEVRGESGATCGDCALCRPPEVRVEEPPYLFNTAVKCCTYLPELPNFSVGRILRDGAADNEVGRRTVRERIAAGDGVTPLGLGQTESFRSRYRPDGPGFGRDVSLRCPHYAVESGSCSIWRYRESTCSTWSCKHDRGARGQRFLTTLRELLKEMEYAIAAWCTTAVNAAASPASWGDAPEEREVWYRACAAVADGLEGEEALRIGGEGAAARLDACREALRERDEERIPDRLRPGTFAIVGRGDSFARVVGYSPLDPLDLPDPLTELLARFDGRPTAEVVAGIAEEFHLRAGDEVLRPLVDFGILERGP
jgi:hypothetical protein